MQPGNPMDKYAVCVKRNKTIVGHLPLGKNGRFAKTIFYLLKNDPCAVCNVYVSGKAVNLGDGDGMQVPCTLGLISKKEMINILKHELCK